MNVLAIRTDSSMSHILLYRDAEVACEIKWESGKQLAKDILSEVQKLCASVSIAVQDVAGVICYEGPGSFTGLRIGITVGNALAYANGIPIVGSAGDDWLGDGFDKLKVAHAPSIILPRYGSEPHITL
jgi:tRNA threonylcarbamoyladenosine biosynthesis protein TsaB